MLDAAASRAYMDFSQFAQMRADAKASPQDSLREVAKQFESIFVNMMLKSMRDASFGDELFDSNQSELYQEMFDKQIALDMTKDKGIGLADVLVQQMQRYAPAENGTKNTASQISNIENKVTDPFVGSRSKTDFKTTKEFVDVMMPHAETAAEALGVDPKVLVAQAALETGWGNAVGKKANGKSSFNLFNIKASAGYEGNAYRKNTLEYINGAAKLEKSSFRSYNNYQESFDDYVNFIKTNSRYQDALNNASESKQYINGLQQAGYATDPNYAAKVTRVMQTLPVTNNETFDDYG